MRRDRDRCSCSFRKKHGIGEEFSNSWDFCNCNVAFHTTLFIKGTVGLTVWICRSRAKQRRQTVLWLVWYGGYCKQALLHWPLNAFTVSLWTEELQKGGHHFTPCPALPNARPYIQSSFALAQEKKFEKLASGSSEIQSFASCFGLCLDEGKRGRKSHCSTL